MADYSTEIAELEAILQAGATSVTIDGQSVKYDFKEIRRRLRELRSMDDDSIAAGRVRPVFSKINLTGF